MPKRLAARIDTALERWLPEQRLFLKSDDATRFVRLRPTTQIAAMLGGAVMLGTAILGGSVLAFDALGQQAGTDQAQSNQTVLESRVATLATQRDGLAGQAEAVNRKYAAAMAEMSKLQARLMQAERRAHEMEAGIGSVQASLHDALADRDIAQRNLAEATGPSAPGAKTDAERARDLTLALDTVSAELQTASAARSAAEARAATAAKAAREIAAERDRIIAHNDAVLSQIEDAVSVSVKPMDDMFKKIGIDSDKLLATIDSGYSGQGGPLTPMGVSTSGNADVNAADFGLTNRRAGDIVISLDKVNRYRIAAHKMPLAMPVKSAFRFTSGFGPRWGRQHQGVDLAGPVGTPIHATGEGVVTFAGWQRGYGNLIKIQHELGVETRYGHLSKINVRVGQRVSQNSLIGAMGNTGRSTGPHLHYEVRVNGAAVNPMSFMKAAENVF